MRKSTPEEMDDIKLYAILPMLLDLVDKYKWFPEITPLKHLHEDQFQELLDMITLDHVEVKQRLRNADIKVVKDWQPGLPSLDYKIYLGRYQETLRFWKQMVKADMSVALGEYVGRLDKSKFKIRDTVVTETKKEYDQKLFVNFD